MKFIERNVNVINGSQDLVYIGKFPNYPIFPGCTTEPIDTDVNIDMNWYISKSTGIIQLNPLISEETLYNVSHGSGSVGKIWKQHHENFAEFIQEVEAKNILEIGGAHGALSKCYQKNNDADWTIIEPTPSPLPGVKAKYIDKFYSKDLITKDYDMIVHSHVLEHIYKPNDFFEELSNKIEIGTAIAFSLPNMNVALQKFYSNCLQFEHTIFLTEPYIEYLLSKNNLKLLKKKYFLEDHSIFYLAIKQQDVPIQYLPKDLFDINKKIFIDYIQHYNETVNKLNGIISNANSAVYIFGAHMFTQALISFGLKPDKIKNVLDNDESKQNKRLYGTNLIVKSPSILREENNPIIILKAGQYNSEIKEDIISNINKTAKFLE